ncbi:MAG: GreA/GreB family elongation factor [Verrucomicrobia bacterium]|nr:GreA/GreB family elongation factor [Verrucomicrobiota bacterium]MBS0646692.1 GreA/GreB family elongation factor [Verrucomicrobiota bacterium]
MSYLEEFRQLIEKEKLSPFLHLWEEYCQGDQICGEEVFQVLTMIKNSSLSTAFGKVAETAIPLWEKIEEEEMAGHVLRLIIDLQTTHSPLLATLAVNYLSSHYKDDSDFNEKMRLVGLRTRHSFQGAISNFELLSHMEKGKFVFHTGGWGVGEVMDISLLQEHVLLEFEGIGARKDLTFENAFKNLVYLPSDHFLARRFGNPDALEEEGKQDPLALVRLVLRDLGPKTAQGLKEELCELVIPEQDWSKWWQAARAKLKKDTKIKSPNSSKEPFEILDEEVSHEDLLKKALQNNMDTEKLIVTVYQYLRDFPQSTKSDDIKELLKKALLGALEEKSSVAESVLAYKIQISFLLEDIFPTEFPEASASLVKAVENLEGVINLIEILAYKKRLLVCIRGMRSDWEKVFSHLLLIISQNPLRDYLFKELLLSNPLLLEERLQELLNNMTLYPEPFFWYFQKVAEGEQVPLNSLEDRFSFMEAYLILLHYVEDKDECRDLVKKMYNYLLADRFVIVRKMIADSPVSFLKEFLLLASKCLVFSKQDLRTLQSLAEVVQPSLANKKKSSSEDEEIIWTTQAGYQKIQERVKQIGTIEMIDNAREIEAARAHGDLRENSEYKFALERRSRLQSELKTLSRQLNHARILTKSDVSTHLVGPGSVIELSQGSEESVTYSLLGPWDADPDKHILSFQSKFAQAMMGRKLGESFEFQGNNYQIKSIHSFLETPSIS